MYTLYYAPGSAAMLVHLMLLECAVPYTLRKLDLEAGEQRSAEYLALNPDGVVPTLVIDGQAHAESAALAMLLAERHPEAALAPTAGSAARADYLQWMFYLANTLQPAFRQWFYSGEHVADGADVIKKAARIRIESAWSRLDKHLFLRGPHMLSSQFSVVDLYATMLMRWSRNMPRPATEWPHLATLAATVKTRESWRRMYAIEELTEWA
ncbi:MAG TPA: glutathione S-transferase family protein [Rudaea sp.]|nr:glutathione S-transferase family protein [Rudaea sp.]